MRGKEGSDTAGGGRGEGRSFIKGKVKRGEEGRKARNKDDLVSAFCKAGVTEPLSPRYILPPGSSP